MAEVGRVVCGKPEKTFNESLGLIGGCNKLSLRTTREIYREAELKHCVVSMTRYVETMEFLYIKNERKEVD